MPAFRRRTVFAVPVIVIASCGGPQVREPEPPHVPGTRWRVDKRGGECVAHSIEGPCPRGAMCNPPPPRPIECPVDLPENGDVVVVEKPDKACAVVPEGCTELACVTPATACPTPWDTPARPKPLAEVWRISRYQAGCLAHPERSCPDGPCQAPDARAAACPLTLGMPPAFVRVAQLAGGSCATVPDECADDSCAKDPVACPLPAGRDLPPLTWDLARAGNACTATSRGPIAGERTIKVGCPREPTQAPRFRIRRPDVSAPCELVVGTSAPVPTACPE